MNPQSITITIINITLILLAIASIMNARNTTQTYKFIENNTMLIEQVLDTLEEVNYE